MTQTAHTQTESYTIECRMQPESAALERLCQVVRIRGFTITDMTVHTGQAGLEMALTVQGTRPIAMLCAQLEKLQTTRGVTHRALAGQPGHPRSLSA